MAMLGGYVNDCWHSSRAHWLVLRIVGTLYALAWFTIVTIDTACCAAASPAIYSTIGPSIFVAYRSILSMSATRPDGGLLHHKLGGLLGPPFLCVRSGGLSAYHASEVYLLSDNDASRIVGIDHTMWRIRQGPSACADPRLRPSPT